MVPNVPWHRAPRRKGPPAPQKFFLRLFVIYIGNQITDIYAIRYHTSTVHGSRFAMYATYVKKHITHDDYKNCLLNREEQMRIIRSHLHDVYTEEVNKVALSVEDDKRVIMEDGIHTFGLYSVWSYGVWSVWRMVIIA